MKKNDFGGSINFLPEEEIGKELNNASYQGSGQA
jgi:hypothetical protein